MSPPRFHCATGRLGLNWKRRWHLLQIGNHHFAGFRRPRICPQIVAVEVTAPRPVLAALFAGRQRRQRHRRDQNDGDGGGHDVVKRFGGGASLDVVDYNADRACAEQYHGSALDSTLYDMGDSHGDGRANFRAGPSTSTQPRGGFAPNLWGALQ